MMLSFIINKCLNKTQPPPQSSSSNNNIIVVASKNEEKGDTEGKKKESSHHQQKQQQMRACKQATKGSSSCPNQDQGCCAAPTCLGLTGNNHQASSRGAIITRMTTTRISRSNFRKYTTSTLFPNIQFTNHESLPCLQDALSGFNQTYPQYKETQEADRIRQHHYSHLSHHVCLDYTGLTLFSHSQLHLPLPPSPHPPPFFDISYKPASLTSQVIQEGFDSAIRNRIMSFLNVSTEDYTMVCTANRTSALKLLVEAYPFTSNNSLLTVYDYESQGISAMQECAHKRGAKVMSATFSWPNLSINSPELKKILVGNNKKRDPTTTTKKKKKKRGLFVFPLQSRMTGTRYPYLWMRFAQENGWHVVLDACALGPKELDAFGLSLIQPDFIICSFYKVVGQDPSGFAGFLIKKSSSRAGLLDQASSPEMGCSIGIVSIVPPTTSTTKINHEYDAIDLSATFSEIDEATSPSVSKNNDNAQMEKFEQGETSSNMSCQSSSLSKGTTSTEKGKSDMISTIPEIVELESNCKIPVFQAREDKKNACSGMECLGLDHADSLGMLLISSRLRYITNWLVMALLNLWHPNSEINGHPLVRIYGPRIKFERGHSIAFNVFDWKGEKVEPALVQKLGDRFNISLSCGFLRNIHFSDKYGEEKDAVLEKRLVFNACDITTCGGGRNKIRKLDDQVDDLGIVVVNASLCFLTNFEDAYKLWSFVARFLDADFVEKERWRYMALNQKMIEL